MEAAHDLTPEKLYQSVYDGYAQLTEMTKNKFTAEQGVPATAMTETTEAMTDSTTAMTDTTTPER